MFHVFTTVNLLCPALYFQTPGLCKWRIFIVYKSEVGVCQLSWRGLPFPLHTFPPWVLTEDWLSQMTKSAQERLLSLGASLPFLAPVGRCPRPRLSLVNPTNWKSILVLPWTSSLVLPAGVNSGLVTNRDTGTESMGPSSIEFLNGAKKKQASHLRQMSPPGARSHSKIPAPHLAAN